MLSATITRGQRGLFSLSKYLFGGLGVIQPVLFRVGIEPAEDIRGSRFLEFNGRDEAQDVVPELDDVLLIAVRGRLNFPRRTIQGLPAAEDVEPLMLEVLKARGIRKPRQMAVAKIASLHPLFPGFSTHSNMW
jgi:hypothetical protein